MKPLNKTNSAASRSPTALLIYLFLIFAGLCNGIFAQSDFDVGQIHDPDVKSSASNKTLHSNNNARPSDEPRELSGFFMIGIAINIVVLLLFAVWFVSQWKKQNKRSSETLE